MKFNHIFASRIPKLEKGQFAKFGSYSTYCRYKIISHDNCFPFVHCSLAKSYCLPNGSLILNMKLIMRTKFMRDQCNIFFGRMCVQGMAKVVREEKERIAYTRN